jgi:hypothetical protein
VRRIRFSAWALDVFTGFFLVIDAMDFRNLNGFQLAGAWDATELIC